ncbi:MAG TPA: hypothetical protein DCM71_14120 [Runella sp.]|nr:hypothetical protein [Runella sp.]
MKTIILVLLTSGLGAFAQLRHYGTKEYSEFLKKLGDTEKIFTDAPKSIKQPITLSLTFVVLSKEITKDQLLKQIAILNEDFSNKTFENATNQNPHYKQLATDTEIRFYENFNLIEAYTEEKINFVVAQEYIKKMAIGGGKSIPIYIGDLEQTAGFAQLPGYSANNDAIFLHKDYCVGSQINNFHLGKTLTHLMGSYLGLGELWDCQDDGIADTPLMSVEHFDYEGGWSSCYRYIVETMPQNFMYNTQDKYLNMFTKGQKERMLKELSTRRYNLVTPIEEQSFRNYSNREYFRLPEFKNPPIDTVTPKKLDLPATLSLAFHIFYPKGGKPTITEEQIKKQIEVLNRDFGKPTPPDSTLGAHHYARLAADTEIQFCPKYSINYIETSLSDFTDLQAIKQPEKGGIAPQKGAINIWVADLKNSAGYAQLPGYSSKTDGIVLNQSYFLGVPQKEGQRFYSLGKTLTHLMGNFLGLIDLWGLDDCQDDGVLDTPLHSGPTLFKGKAISLCYSYIYEQMVSNFMDNSPDEILWMFTKGQKEKMLNELRTHRYDLITSSLCR